MKIVYTTEFLLSFKDRDECKVYPVGLQRMAGVTHELKLSSSERNMYNKHNHGSRKKRNMNKRYHHSHSYFNSHSQSPDASPKPNGYSKKDKERRVLKENTNYNQIKGLLNKLTIEKYTTISQKILRTIRNANEDEMSKIIELIFEKAVTELNYTEMYSRLCKYLNVDIKHVLIHNFNICVKSPEESSNKFIGICQLIAEQWNHSLLDSGDVQETINYITSLIKVYIESESILDIEALVKGCCQYIFTLDKKKAINDNIVRSVIIKTCKFMKYIKKAYYDNIRLINSRTMFNIMNTVELFDNNWVPIHKIHEKTGPSSIREIRHGKSETQRTCSPWKQRLIEKQRRDEEQRRAMEKNKEREEEKEKEKDYKITKNMHS